MSNVEIRLIGNTVYLSFDLPTFPATLIVSPSGTSVVSGDTLQFTEQAYDSLGNPVSSTPVWSVASTSGPFSTTVQIVASNPSAESFVRSDDRTGGDWAVARNGTGTVMTAPPPPEPNEYDRMPVSATVFTFGWARAEESYFEFDSTGIIPAGATLTNAFITLYAFRDDGGANRVIEIVFKDYGGGNVTTGDFVPGANLAALTLAATLTVVSPRPLGTAELFTSAAGMLAGIVKNGVTRFMAYDRNLRTNTTPATEDTEIIFCSPSHATVAYRPKLTVTYT